MKERQCQEYRDMVSKYSDRKLLQELKSYRKHFQSHSQFYDWTYLNPDDFGVNDRFNIIRDVVKERGLKEW